MKHRAGATHGLLPARSLSLGGHGGEESMGKDAGIGIVPGLDIDAREVCGIYRPRLPDAQREFVHTQSIIQTRESRKRISREKYISSRCSFQVLFIRCGVVVPILPFCAKRMK